MFLVISRSDVRFAFELPFCTFPIECASKIAYPKSRALGKKLTPDMSISIQENLRVVFKEDLVAFSLTFFANALRLNLQPNINFFITKVYHLFHHVRRKTATIYKRGVKQIITTE